MNKVVITLATMCGLSFIPVQAMPLEDELVRQGFSTKTARILSTCIKNAEIKYQVPIATAGMICIDMFLVREKEAEQVLPKPPSFVESIPTFRTLLCRFHTFTSVTPTWCKQGHAQISGDPDVRRTVIP